MPESGSLDFFTSPPGSVPQTAYPTDEQSFQPFPSSNFNPSAQVPDNPYNAGISRSNTFPQEHAVFPSQQQQPPQTSAVDPNTQQLTPSHVHGLPTSAAGFEGQQGQFAGLGMDEEGFQQFVQATSQAGYLAGQYNSSSAPTSYPHQF